MRKPIALFEIAIMITAIAAFSFIVGESVAPLQNIQKESKIITFARESFISWFGANLVSAEGENSFWTCEVNKQGSLCQEYLSTTCDSQCTTACFPVPRESLAQCKLGTCIDSKSGTCSAKSPKAVCEKEQGIWKDGLPSEIAECKQGCCVVGDDTSFVNSKICNSLAQKRGIAGVFKPEIGTEIECSLLARPNEEGACVLVKPDGDNGCRFTSKTDCQASSGAFYVGKMCSASELKTTCQKQATTGCAEGKDEVYWFDSCGNRENIFDANKVKSWNNGKLLGKSESCELGTTSNPLLKQTTCGNCNYIGGSICGTTRQQDDKPVVGDVVCRDLSCVDENGQERKHGEGWCAFNSQIGVQETGNGQRSVDVPGSRHFKKSCLRGEIITDPCQDFRNEVCYEERDEEVGFSSAACRLNEKMLCLKANENAEELAKCEENPDCVLKPVDIDANFRFSLCVPRYPPGFDITENENSGDADAICALGTWTCTYQKTKGSIFSGDRIINANCREPIFTETMNNLCMSLGDCGMKVNVIGDLGSSGYEFDGAPDLDADYLSKLKQLSQPKSGQYVAKQVNDRGDTARDHGDALAIIGTIAGMGGIALAYVASAGIGSSILGAGGLGLTEVGFVSEGFTFNPGLSGAGGALVGAAIGAAAAALIIQYTGIGRGMSSTEIGALVGLAAIGGGIIGYALAAGIAVPIAGWIIVAVVGVYMLFSWATGVGKTTTSVVGFTCLPWQPPRGGEKCGECGKNELPCSKYQCQSLGLTCQFINEGTSDEACINIAPKDVSAPIISADSSVVQTGFSYDQVSDLGYVVKGPGADGCLPAYSKVGFGISLSEPGQCRFESVHKDKYDDMTKYFDLAKSNIYSYKHGMFFPVPSLDALATNPASAIDRTQKNDFALYVRCIDKSGNANVREYAISFCVAPEQDREVAIIDTFTPPTDSAVALTATEKEIRFITNEPAECKWGTTDQDYNLMPNEAICNDGLEQGTIFGWACRAKLPTSADTNTYYFRCKDQPWLTGAETDGRVRNANTQSVPYSLRKTTTALTIVSVSPKDELITAANTPISVELKVTTAGGIDGTATCEFATQEGGRFANFWQTGTSEHSQPDLTFFIAKKYVLPIKCHDEAGNKAESNASFELLVDRNGPLITRVYYDSQLNVVTNEKSSCAVSIESCTFDFDKGTLMSGSEFAHTASLDKQITNFVKCKDDYGNVGACMAVKKGAF